MLAGCSSRQELAGLVKKNKDDRLKIEHLGQLKKDFVTERPDSADEQNMRTSLADSLADVCQDKAVDKGFWIEPYKPHEVFANLVFSAVQG